MKAKPHQHTGETKWKIENFPDKLSFWLAAALQTTSLQFTFLQPNFLSCKLQFGDISPE